MLDIHIVEITWEAADKEVVIVAENFQPPADFENVVDLIGNILRDAICRSSLRLARDRVHIPAIVMKIGRVRGEGELVGRFPTALISFR